MFFSLLHHAMTHLEVPLTVEEYRMGRQKGMRLQFTSLSRFPTILKCKFLTNPKCI